MKFEGVCLLTTDVPKLAQFYSTVFATEAEGGELLYVWICFRPSLTCKRFLKR